MKKILLTNDDGITRPGLWFLYDVLKELGEVRVVAPESARSSTGMSITLHKPLRLRKLSIHGTKAYACSGTPSDCVIIALKKVFEEDRPDLIVSGINEGNNVSLQAIYGSGTVAAAVRGALMNVPSIAFSLAFKENEPVKPRWLREAMYRAAARAKSITEWTLRNGLPGGIDYLNVNFPPTVNHKTPVKLTKAAKARYQELVSEKTDPRGKPYYWLYGMLLGYGDMEPGTDAYAVFVEDSISISPMKVDASAADPSILSELVNYLTYNI